MSKRKRWYTAQEEIDLGVLCPSCKWKKAQFSNHEDMGYWTAIRFRCKHCGKLIVHNFPSIKCKELRTDGK